MKKRLLTLGLVASIAAAGYYVYARPPSALVLTGIVTTHEVVVSPQIGGKIDQLLVAEGDLVKKNQRLAVITPDELMAESAFYEQSAAGLSSHRFRRAKRRSAFRSARRSIRSGRPNRRSRRRNRR